MNTDLTNEPRPVWDPKTGTWTTAERVSETTGPVRPDTRPASPVRTASASALKAGLLGGIIGSLLTTGVIAFVPGLGGGMGAESAAPIIERRVEGAKATRELGSIVDIAAKASPWVVNIDVTGLNSRGSGSGIILRSDGTIVTNAHVVAGARQVEVSFADGKKVPGRVVGADADTDIAVLKTDLTGLPSAEIGSAKDLVVGELAVAIGSPLGLDQTVTAGIVSALGRVVDRPDGPPLVDMIQTDAAVTQGNSGGALVDGSAALVGINSAIATSPQVGAEGIAFAIPIDIAKAVADEIIATGRATHPWLGVQLSTIDEETAKRFNTSTGALIESIVQGSPAELAGLKANDIVLSADGKRVASSQELVVELRNRKVGDKVKLEVQRSSEKVSVEATLGDRPQR